MLLARLLPARVKVAAALALGCAAGAMLALQARINGELTERVGPALISALTNFVVGLVVVVAVLTVTRRWPAVASLRSGERRLWWFGGGLCGVLLVATVAYAVPIVGVSLLVICLVAGQLVGGLVVDRAGISPGGQRPVTAARLAGAALAMCAVLLSRWGSDVEVRLLIIALISLGGFMSAVQQAANAHLRRHSDDVLVAVLVNFVVGTVALVVLCVAQFGGDRLGDISWPGQPLWLYAGGVLGVAFVAITTSLVRLLGVLRLTMSVVAGQLLGALLLDVFWRTAARPTAQLYAALVLVLVAVSVAGRGTRSSLRR
ncbi:MAG: DMT family transporter [Mycobacteriales bacterium]